MSRLTDVVYPIRPGEWNGELRYSLRSLDNLPHRSVVLAGFIPSWVRNIVPVPREQVGSRFAKAQGNLAAALQLPELSEPFYLFNDDFYIMRAIGEIPPFHLGPLEREIGKYRANHHTGSYWKGMVATFQLLQKMGFPNPLSYEAHIPLPIYKAPMLEAIERGKGIEALALRTLYGNLAGIGGMEVEDVKVKSRRNPIPWESIFLSSNRDIPHSPLAHHLATRFPNESRYEQP